MFSGDRQPAARGHLGGRFRHARCVARVSTEVQRLRAVDRRRTIAHPHRQTQQYVRSRRRGQPLADASTIRARTEAAVATLRRRLQASTPLFDIDWVSTANDAGHTYAWLGVANNPQDVSFGRARGRPVPRVPVPTAGSIRARDVTRVDVAQGVANDDRAAVRGAEQFGEVGVLLLPALTAADSAAMPDRLNAVDMGGEQAVASSRCSDRQPGTDVFSCGSGPSTTHSGSSSRFSASPCSTPRRHRRMAAVSPDHPEPQAHRVEPPGTGPGPA